MTAVKQGYTHPLLGDRVITLINLQESGFGGSDIVFHTTEIALYAPSKAERYMYTGFRQGGG